MKIICHTRKHCCAKELCRTMKCWCYIGILILLPLSLRILSVAVPVIGIIMELKHNYKHCEDHDKVIFIVYCVFDIFSYLLETCVRLLMIFAAIEVNRIWSHASASLKKVHTNETDNERTNQILKTGDLVAIHIRYYLTGVRKVARKQPLQNIFTLMKHTMKILIKLLKTGELVVIHIRHYLAGMRKVASKLNKLVRYSRHGLYCPG